MLHLHTIPFFTFTKLKQNRGTSGQNMCVERNDRLDEDYVDTFISSIQDECRNSNKRSV